jgi:Tol biopolymer transport system component
VFSLNLDTGAVKKRCDLGYGYEQNYSAQENYFFDPDKKHYIDIDYDDPNGYWKYNYRDINTGEVLNTIVTLEESERYTWDIQFSKNGDKITFSQDFIYCVNVDGTELKKLVSGFYPTFSPDGNKILFLAQNGYLTLYDLVSDDYEQLYFENCIEYPVFHPNGEKIYFFDESDLKTYNLSDSTITIIAEDLSFSSQLQFSNTGDQKVFYTFMKVFTLDENDNINQLNLVSSPYPCISGDGSKIAVADGLLTVLDFAGTAYTEFERALNNTGFGFSPDGKEVYYINTWKDE